MKPKDLLTTRNYPSILVYGPAGTGKTALVAQAPDAYMLDFDDGMRTAAILEDKFTPLRHECEFDTFIDENPLTPTIWKKDVENKITELRTLSALGKLPYKTIIVDSLTGMCKCMQMAIMSANGGSFVPPKIQHWGMLVAGLEKALTILRSLRCVLVVTAHEISIDVDNNNLIRPFSITKNHSLNKLAWLFDEVFHTSVKQMPQNKIQYQLTSRPTTSILARTRSSTIGTLDLATSGFAEILEKIGYKSE